MFGGSFDPVHNAHLIVARLACEQLHLDRVLFIVAAAQPLKHGRHSATAAQRLHMLTLALTGERDLVADDRELRRPPPSYTIDTLRELAGEHPGADLVLIIGADAARQFGDWRDPEGIRALARIAVCHRPGAADTLPPRGFDAEIIVPSVDISSTTIRTRAAARRSVSGWVPPAVADYIVASQLYVE